MHTDINAGNNTEARKEFEKIKAQFKTYGDIEIYNKNLKRDIKKAIQQSKDYFLKENRIWW